jgi:hypothetical protein
MQNVTWFITVEQHLREPLTSNWLQVTIRRAVCLVNGSSMMLFG